MSIKYVLPRCDKCRQTVTPKQGIKFVWKKRNANLILCPTCFSKLYQEHLKDVEISKKVLVKSGYYKEGAREVDFKHYLEKWAKSHKDRL